MPEEDSESDAPLSQLKRNSSSNRGVDKRKRKKENGTSSRKVKTEGAPATTVKTEPEDMQITAPLVQGAGVPPGDPPVGPAGGSNAAGDTYRWWDNDGGDGNGKKWTTLSHHGVIFPPEYTAHEIPIKYDGEPVPLAPRAEEVATFYAAKLETEYVTKETFNRNFFNDFRATLVGTPAYSIVKELELCDFSDIHAHLEKLKQEKKDLPAAEKKKIKEAEAEKNLKYTTALVDGRLEKVGNYRVEPPALFLGRGEHPLMGKVKARIYPEDITINIGEESEVPPVPIEGHKWGTIVHKHDVTWLCGWKDSITNGHKYVWLAAGSAFKGMSDHAKFEKARKLHQHIAKVRADYRAGWRAKSKEIRQRSVAMYLIDKLALRVGNEKGEDEADTVGCCSLRVEHISFMPDNNIEFDFLGKDSIRYYNQVEVEKQVYDNMRLFCKKKDPKQLIFHRLTVTGLNEYLKDIMDGLSAKVFRTYNASITLDELLSSTPANADLNEKIVFYNQQNKAVAILCNHQRAQPKGFTAQMEKIDQKIDETNQWIKELKRGKSALGKSAEDIVEVTQYVPEKAELTADMDEKQRAAEKKRAAEAPRVPSKKKKNKKQIENLLKTAKERLAKLKADKQVKEDLKTVALGTSKINYLDPRITVAWCKKHEVPIERIFTKTLLVKFAWSMETSEKFHFQPGAE